LFRSDVILMAEDHRPLPEPTSTNVVSVDARTSTERLDAALRRIEQVVEEFDHRLVWN
jgi:hypothetical protein